MARPEELQRLANLIAESFREDQPDDKKIIECALSINHPLSPDLVALADIADNDQQLLHVRARAAQLYACYTSRTGCSRHLSRLARHPFVPVRLGVVVGLSECVGGTAFYQPLGLLDDSDPIVCRRAHEEIAEQCLLAELDAQRRAI